MEKKFKMDLSTQNHVDWPTAGYTFRVELFCAISVVVICVVHAIDKALPEGILVDKLVPPTEK
jgi:hypothetical protein